MFESRAYFVNNKLAAYVKKEYQKKLRNECNSVSCTFLNRFSLSNSFLINLKNVIFQ